MQIIVRETGHGKFNQEIIAGEHRLIADEPVANGGNNLGPSPYEYLLAALGACTSMTLRMYANFKKIALERVIVHLSYDKIHAEDCAECENKDMKLDHIDRKIELHGTLSPDEKQKLLDIANKCPVHRTLTSKIIITTEIMN